MPAVKLGRNARLEVRAGGVTGGSAEWLTVGSAVDVTLSLTKEADDVTARDSDGWKQELPVTKVARAEFGLVWRDVDAARAVLIAAWNSGATVGARILDGANGQGLQCNMQVMDLTQAQPVGGGITASIALSPIPGSAARWIEALGPPSAPATSAADQGGGGTAWTNPAAAVTENGAPATVVLSASGGSTSLRFAIPPTLTERSRVFVRIKCSVTTAGDGAYLSFTTPITGVDDFLPQPTDTLSWLEIELTPLDAGWEDELAAGFNIDISAVAGSGMGQTFTIDDVQLRLA